ncbi:MULTISPECIES: FUSC family protein [Nocardiopsis]|uniref:Fusaric acid resistance-like family protein n=1 Tax=Nocardiopsis sinuspersici TaxID=501010 RepID=A0A1V3C0S3_9ACTN|nr:MULTISPECIES: FUSC family protein [Nocardiopsis]OOC54315.1 fusaric acid resistance -like family protein [Nocardiopsis sinuspersici]
MRYLNAPVHSWWRWAREAGSAALGRLSANKWSVLQAAIAATVAWVVAGGLVHDHSPFFAPIAAVVALNTVGGERGTNAVRMLLGVVIGIVVGELSIAVTGGGYVAMALAIGVAMAIAVAVGAARLVIAQSAAGAILTVAFADGQVGPSRLTDALIGAGVALVMSQLLFPTRPTTRLRGIETAALVEIVGLLDATGRALEEDEDPSLRTVDRLGALSRPMADLSRAQENSHRNVRWSTARWTSPEPLRYEDERVDRLIILGESCLSLARTAAAMDLDERRRIAPVVCEMAAVLDVLADDLGDRSARQRAVDLVLDVARPFGADTVDDPVTAATHLSVQMVATDIMLFAGLEPERAAQALSGEEEEPKVAHPPAEPWLPWPRRGASSVGSRRLRLRRWPFRRR